MDTMTNVQTKRVYDPAEPSDGYRVLVDRLWPRGVRKEALRYDWWARDLAPSASLRRWFHEDKEGRWEAFRRKYLRELEASSAAADFIGRLRGKPTVTLLYAMKDTTRNQAVILRDYLERALS